MDPMGYIGHFPSFNRDPYEVVIPIFMKKAATRHRCSEEESTAIQPDMCQRLQGQGNGRVQTGKAGEDKDGTRSSIFRKAGLPGAVQVSSLSNCSCSV